jgi:hypothetical protein
MSRPEASSVSNASTGDAHGDGAWREAAALGEVGSTYYGLTRNDTAQRLPESAVSGRVDLGEREGRAGEDKVRGEERKMNMSTSVPIGAGRWICT